jgi:hypothetical protein
VRVVPVRFFARHLALRRSVALLLATLLCGCVSWQPVMAPQGYVTARRPDHVRAVFNGGSTIDLYAPTIAGDQLTGRRYEGNEASRISIPMDRVRRVEVLKPDGHKTGILVGTVAAVGLLVALAAASMNGMKGAWGAGLGGF